MSDQITLVSAETMQTEWVALARSPALGLLLDLDGTLIPFAPTLEDARLDDDAVVLLDRLQASGVQVVIVSGRPQAAVDGLRPLAPAVWWVAEHGIWRTASAAGWQTTPQRADLGDIEGRLASLAAYIGGARIERKSRSVVLHWRQVAEDARAALIAAAEVAVDEWLETQPEFERLDGAMVLEVRHRSANKGTAVPWVRERLPLGARLIAMGDDLTDEDMFAALGAGDASVGVGASASRRGHADWWLDGPHETRRFLAWLAETRAIPGAPGPVPMRALDHPRHITSRSSELLLLSNRTPVVEGGRAREVGGLVSALQPIVSGRGAVWLGWSGHERDPGLALTAERDGRGMRATFDYPIGWRETFYAGFCNQSLWPLLHCFPGRVRYSDEEWVAYVAANEAYARVAAQIASPDGTVWVHDFHLMLAGSALRHLGHRGPLGFFLHVPFPPRDVWETLPWSDEVIDAMTSFDLIGFHTARWAENFLAAAARHCVIAPGQTLIRHGRRTRVGVFPMGIEAAAFAPTSTSPIPADVEGLRAVLGNRKLLLGVDRLDYSKGIPERLEAFRRLLQLHPDWRGQVSFVQVSVPSRADVPEYAALRRRVEELVGRINGEFGEADWVPVRYLYRSYQPELLAHLYRLADVGVVTPLRDGMNLVAKEFVAAQDPATPGALVLSKFAGAADELAAAILTNPFHTDGMAADLDRALRMPLEERRQRHAQMVAAMAGTGAAAWADAFLDHLAIATRDRLSSGTAP